MDSNTDSLTNARLGMLYTCLSEIVRQRANTPATNGVRYFEIFPYSESEALYTAKAYYQKCFVELAPEQAEQLKRDYKRARKSRSRLFAEALAEKSKQYTASFA